MKPARQRFPQILLALTIDRPNKLSSLGGRSPPRDRTTVGSADAVERTITLAASMYPHPHHRDFTLTYDPSRRLRCRLG
jgi:hypothetical protein